MKNFLIFDKSPRTTAISRPFYAVIALFLIMALSFTMIHVGTRSYNKMLANSSTAIGSSLTFSMTGAQVKLRDIYTDENENVMIARLTPQPGADALLPYRGTDYQVFVKSKATEKSEKLPILFGKMGTDGDMFLVVPKPADTVYSFGLVNMEGASLLELEKNRRGSDRRTSTLGDSTQSVTRALSEFDDESTNNSSGDAGTMDASETSVGSRHDMTGFRMTLAPHSDDPKFQPETIQADLYDESTGEFDFKTFFEKVYIDTAVRSLTKEFNARKSEIAQARDMIDRLDERLAANPNDQSAKDNLKQYDSLLTQYKRSQEETVDELTRYQNLVYEPEIFRDFLNEAIVI